MQNLRTVINNKPSSYFGTFSNMCTKSKKSHLKSYTITYLFSFNGQERDDEVSGAGNTMTAEFWEYDARLGRRWNMDPEFKRFPWLSPFNTFENNPILKNDPNGDSPPDNSEIKSTVNSISKNRKSYTISETTIISKTRTNEIQNDDGTRTIKTNFTQTRITSITTISYSGEILENKSEVITYSRTESNTYIDNGPFKSFYEAYGYKQNVIDESFTNESNNQFLGPISQVVKFNLLNGLGFPVNDDMESQKAIANQSEWMGSNYINQKGKRVPEPGLKYYKKGNDLRMEIFDKDKFGMKTNKTCGVLTFKRPYDYMLYNEILRRTLNLMN
jgi:hypothetical protein